MAHIRIESHQNVVTNAKIFYVDGDQETDISSCVQLVEVHLNIGLPPSVTFRACLGSADITTPRPVAQVAA